MHGRERHGESYYVCETACRQATLVAAEHPKMIAPIGRGTPHDG
jgi:hypothetical protein